MHFYFHAKPIEPCLFCIDVMYFTEVVVILFQEILEVYPHFIGWSLLATHVAYLCVESFGKHHFVDIIDDLCVQLILLAIKCILDTVINPLKLFFNGHHDVQCLI